MASNALLATTGLVRGRPGRFLGAAAVALAVVVAALAGFGFAVVAFFGLP